MNNLTELAKEQLKKDKGFIASNNYEIIKVEKNYCELVGKLTETSMNHYGIAHGGYIFGLADTAAGIAAMTDGRNVVTINSTIDYFKPGKGNYLKAIAKCLKNGKTVSFFEINVYDEENNLIAKSNITYCNIKKTTNYF